LKESRSPPEELAAVDCGLLRARTPSHIDSEVEFGHVKATHHRYVVILLWWLAATAVALLAMGIGPARDFIERIDQWWFDLMVDAEVDGLTPLAEILAFAGSAYATVPARIAVAVWLGRRAAWDRLGVWLGAIFLSEATLTILKALYNRTRPPAPLNEAVLSSSSFPSGHTVEAMAVAIALVYVFAKAGKPARHWFYVAAAYAVLMAMSRCYLRGCRT
jgi:undecaprenyl-diphosphatase